MTILKFWPGRNVNFFLRNPMHHSLTGPRGNFMHKLSTKLVCKGKRSLQLLKWFHCFYPETFVWSVGGEFPDNKSHLLSGSASWHQTKYFPTFQLRFSSLSHLHLLNSLSISRLYSRLSLLFALMVIINIKKYATYGHIAQMSIFFDDFDNWNRGL